MLSHAVAGGGFYAALREKAAAERAAGSVERLALLAAVTRAAEAANAANSGAATASSKVCQAWKALQEAADNEEDECDAKHRAAQDSLDKASEHSIGLGSYEKGWQVSQADSTAMQLRCCFCHLCSCIQCMLPPGACCNSCFRPQCW